MKRILIQLLLAVILFSACKTEEDNLDISGDYRVKFEGKYLYEGDYFPYLKEFNIQIEKINDKDYRIITRSGQTQTLSFYDDNKVKGVVFVTWNLGLKEIYFYGKVSQEKIYGSFYTSTPVANFGPGAMTATSCYIEDGRFIMTRID